MLTLLYIMVGSLVLTNLYTLINSKGKATTAYWEGRYSGHKVTQDMAMRRAEEKGYDVEKFRADILQ